MATEVEDELPEALEAAMAVDGERLMEELRLLEEMPQVRLVPSSVFYRAKPPGSKPQLRGVSCKLRCCRMPCEVKCNALTDDRACPTHVEAARMLRAKVQEKHGSAECVAKTHAAHAADASAAGSSSAAPAERTVVQLMASQLAIQRAHRELKAAQQQLEERAEVERIASEARVAATAALEEVCSLANLPARLP